MENKDLENVDARALIGGMYTMMAEQEELLNKILRVLTSPREEASRELEECRKACSLTEESFKELYRGPPQDHLDPIFISFEESLAKHTGLSWTDDEDKLRDKRDNMKQGMTDFNCDTEQICSRYTSPKKDTNTGLHS